MNLIDHNARLVAVATTYLSLMACSASGIDHANPQASGIAATDIGISDIGSAPRNGSPGFVLPVAHGHRLVYVSNHNNAILGYPIDVQNPAPFEAITYGINGPTGIWTTSNGDLYVANGGNNTVTAYHAGATAPFYTLLDPPQQPQAVAVDSSGTVYVGNNEEFWTPSCGCDNIIEEFPAGSQGMSKYILEPGPVGMAFDAKDNLYVADYYGDETNRFIYVYPPGSTNPNANKYTSLQLPRAITFSKTGTFFVSDPGLSSVFMFSPNRNAPTKRISVADTPQQAWWASGKLYVAQYNGNQVSVFSKLHGRWSLVNAITQNVDEPIGVAVSPVAVP
jgi:hypothetical protein